MNEPLINQKSIMHELGNALAVMSGNIDLLADTEMTLEQEELIKKIYYSLELVKQIIGNAPDIKTISINAFIEDTISACKVFTASKGICLKFISELEYDEFAVEEYKLFQILINLIKNAAKHTDKGEITVSVKMNDLEKTQCLEFCVSDTGVGISEEYMPYIFDAFVQASDDKSGSGIGLSICKT
jgi:signal transduction histidine kinase